MGFQPAVSARAEQERYAAALRFLNGLPYRLVKPGLERIAYLLERLGSPHRELRAIHIAGTNGKGSVVALLAAMLEEAGYRVGCYTSPHLHDWRERIRVNREPIPAGELARLLEIIEPIVAQMEDKPTIFEVLTAVAFQYFQEQQVDIAVLETGLGGRFDATNVVHPLLAILTNVAADHLELLGPTLADVAREKAGIAKPGSVLLTGERDSELLEIIATECTAQNAKLVRSTREPELCDYDWERQIFCIEPWGELELRLLGPYQGRNLALALEAVRLLRERGLAIPDTAVRGGLARVRWPGRFEVAAREPYLILDGAHNPAGAAALRAGLELYYRKFIAPQGGRRWLVFGALGDKDLKNIIEILFPWFDRVIVTKPDYYRAAAPELLLDLARRHAPRVPAEMITPAREALAVARSRSDSRDLLVIAGSLYLVGELRHELISKSRDERESE